VKTPFIEARPLSVSGASLALREYSRRL
jgi:hypothetical protein